MLYIRFIKRLLLILIVCLFALNIQAMRFRHLSMPDGLSQLSVLSIYQDRLGRMWFGTEEGVNIFDGNTVTAIKKFRGMNPHNIEVRRICGDDNGNVYFLLGRSVVAIDYLTQGSKVIVPDGVSALACHAGHLYYARKGHLCSYRIADKKTKVIASTVGTRPNAIYIDRRGYLWAADGSGLYKISVQSRRVLRFYEAGKAGLGEVGFTDIREDSNGRIYVASVGGGIYRLDEKKHAFQVFDTDNSDIMSNFCYAFANVGKQLIYSTEHGIGVLNTTDDSFRNVEFSHDFPLMGINRGCGLFAVGNTILVGGTNGMVAMDVSRLLATRTHGRLYFSRLYINGKECLPGDGTDILDKAVYLTDEIHLNHDQNNITFGFATDNYTRSFNQPLFEYRLRGYDNTWYTTTGHSISYPKLPAGNYTLEVRMKPSTWQTEGDVEKLALKLKVSPPFYLYTFA